MTYMYKKYTTSLANQLNSFIEKLVIKQIIINIIKTIQHYIVATLDEIHHQTVTIWF